VPVVPKVIKVLKFYQLLGRLVDFELVGSGQFAVGSQRSHIDLLAFANCFLPTAYFKSNVKIELIR
jgi:hypothetical protein